MPDKQLPNGDWPLPVAPQTWHYRQSIDYEMSNNRAVLDYASRYRETLLYNFYRMGTNSIERRQPGSLDHHARARSTALRAAAPAGAVARIAAGLTQADSDGAALPADSVSICPARSHAIAIRAATSFRRISPTSRPRPSS